MFFFSFPLFVNPTNSRNNQINSINANPSHFFSQINKNQSESSKVLSNKFQTPPKRKRASETSADDEYEQQLSLPAQRVSTASDKLQSDMKTTVSEPIQPVRKMTVGSVS